jgi:hypothetical protein
MNALQRVPHGLDEFVAHARTTGAPIYIFGADIAGKVVREMLVRHGLAVAAFLDNNKNKCTAPIADTPVLHAAQLDRVPTSALVLIASTYIADIIRQLEDRGFYQWAPISRMLGGFDPKALSDLLQGALRRNHAGGEFTKDFDAFVLTNMINSQEKYLDPAKLYVRSVDLIVTERCSLKCKDCSNLMQYYEAPVDIHDDELAADLDDVTAVADEINEIRIIGGDPFMNKSFHRAVAHAANKPGVNRVVVYTNGTICPPEQKIAAIAHEKVFVFITTYGDLSKHNEKLASMLQRHGIPFNSQPAYGWTDCADVEKHGRTDEENRELLRVCCAKHFTTLTDGKIFRCPFSANLERLAAIPESPSDYVDIRGAARMAHAELQDLRGRLRGFLRELPVLAACDSCNGRTYGDPEITPGIQTNKPMAYQRYGRSEVVQLRVTRTNP